MDQQGTYYGQYTGAAAVAKGANATPFLELGFHIENVAVNGAWQALPQAIDRHVSMCISDGVWNSAQAKEILLRNLKALGFNGDFNAPEFSCEILTNPTVLTCTDDGKYSKWQIAELAAAEAKPMDTTVGKVMNARYKTAVGMSAKPAGAPAPMKAAAQPKPAAAPPISSPEAEPPPGEPPSGEDIPF